MFEQLAAAVLNHRRKVGIALMAVFLLVTSGAAFLQIDLSFRAFFGRNDPANQAFNAYLEQWGADDDLMLLVVSVQDGSLLEPERARFLVDLGRELEALPTIRTTTSVLTSPFILGDEPGTIDMEPLESAIPTTTGPEWDAWRRRILDSRLMVPTLIATDEQTAAVLVEARYESGDVNEIRPIVAGVQDVLDRHEGHLGMHFGLAGIPPVRAAFFDQFLRDQSIFVPAAFVFISLCLFLIFRRIHGVLVPGLAAALPVAMVFGFMGWTGEPIGMLSQTFTTLLPAIAIADAIHMVSRFHEELRRRGGTGLSDAQKHDAIRTAAAKIGRACLLTSITTGIGFASLYVARMPILRNFGLYAALGIGLAYLGMLLLVPLLLLWTRGDVPPAGREDDPTPGDRFLLACADLSIARPQWVLGVTGVVTLAALFFGQRVVVDNNLTQSLQSDHPVTQANLRADAHLGGILGVEITLQGEPESLKDPAVLQALLDFESTLLDRPDVRQASSPATWVALLHQAAVGTYQAPDSPEAAAQFYLLAEGDPAFLRQINEDYSQARMWVTLRDHGGKAFIAETDRIQTLLTERLSGLPLDGQVTGTPFVAYRGINGVTQDLRNSLALAFVTITLVIGLLFRDLRTGLLCLLPNALPLIMGYGLMGLMGWLLDPTPAVIFTVALGIAVDDTLHLMIRTKEELSEGRTREQAIRVAVLHSGRAVGITSLILAFGFGINGISSFRATAVLGYVGATVIVTALLCDLFVLPALLALWGPKGSAADQSPQPA